MQFFVESPGVAIISTQGQRYLTEHEIMSRIGSSQIHTLRLVLTDPYGWNLMLELLMREHFLHILIGNFGSRDTPLLKELFLLNSDRLTFEGWCHDELLVSKLCCQQNWFNRLVVFHYQPILTRMVSIMQLNTRTLMAFIEVNWVGKRRLPKELLMMLRAFLYK
jgi:hypothetical protein